MNTFIAITHDTGSPIEYELIKADTADTALEKLANRFFHRWGPQNVTIQVRVLIDCGANYEEIHTDLSFRSLTEAPKHAQTKTKNQRGSMRS